MRPFLIAVSIAASALFPARARAQEPSATPARAGGPAPELTDGIRYHDRRYRSVLDAPLREMQPALHSLYRLRPDRRFLLAFGSAHSILTGDSVEIVDVDYRSGRWEIRYRDHVAGVLPDMSDFGDAMAALTEWAARTGLPMAPHASISADPGPAASDEMSIASLAESLGQFQAEWRRNPRPGLLGVAAERLMQLSYQGLDPLELNDRLHARILAVLAVQAAMTGAPDRGTEALLAWSMGYSTFAREAADSLPPDDPIGHLIRRDHTSLREAAERPDARPMTRRLYLDALAATGRTREWATWVDRHEPQSERDLSVMRSAFALRSFLADDVLSLAVPHLVFGEVQRAIRPAMRRRTAAAPAISAPAFLNGLAGDPVFRSLEPAVLLAGFEAALDSLTIAADGAFIDRRLYGDVFRSIMYGAFYVKAGFVLDRLASVPSAERLVSSLAMAPPGPGLELYRWHQALTASMSGHPSTSALVGTVAARRVGGAALVRAFRELAEKSEYGSTEMATGAKYLARRLDSRPEHLSRFAVLALTELYDLRIAETTHERLYSIAGGSYPSRAAWHLIHAGDIDAARSLIDDPALSLAGRSALLRTLAAHLDPDDIERLHRELIATDPTDWALRSDLVSFLERAGRFADAMPVVLEWLASDHAEGGFDWIAARAVLARLLESEGRLTEARTMIAEVVPSAQAGAVGRAIRILIGLGEYDTARQLAADLVDRYPDLDRARADQARVHWASGDPRGAAAVVLGAERRFGRRTMRAAIGGAFAEALEHRPAGALDSAIVALREAGVGPWSLRELASALADHDLHRGAFTVLADLATGHPLGDIEARLLAWRSLRMIDGDSAARAWLEMNISPLVRDPASVIFYSHGEYELLWSMIPAPWPVNASAVWLLRAAASSAPGTGDDGHRQALVDYYSRAGSDAYDVMGRYVLGLIGEDELDPVATAPDRKCEVAYYIGLRALADGRRADASDWLRIAIETGLEEEGEYVWAHRMLPRLVRGQN